MKKYFMFLIPYIQFFGSMFKIEPIMILGFMNCNNSPFSVKNAVQYVSW